MQFPSGQSLWHWQSEYNEPLLFYKVSGLQGSFYVLMVLQVEYGLDHMRYQG